MARSTEEANALCHPSHTAVRRVIPSYFLLCSTEIPTLMLTAVIILARAYFDFLIDVSNWAHMVLLVVASADRLVDKLSLTQGIFQTHANATLNSLLASFAPPVKRMGERLQPFRGVCIVWRRYSAFDRRVHCKREGPSPPGPEYPCKCCSCTSLSVPVPQWMWIWSQQFAGEYRSKATMHFGARWGKCATMPRPSSSTQPHLV